MINYSDDKVPNYDVSTFYNRNLYKHYNHDVSDQKYSSNDAEFDLNDYFYLKKQEPNTSENNYETPKPTCSRRLKPVPKCIPKQEPIYTEQTHRIGNCSHKIETCKPEPIIQSQINECSNQTTQNYVNTLTQLSQHSNCLKYRPPLNENKVSSVDWEQQQFQIQFQEYQKNLSQYVLSLLSTFINKQNQNSSGDLLEKYREYAIQQQQQQQMSNLEYIKLLTRTYPDLLGYNNNLAGLSETRNEQQNQLQQEKPFIPYKKRHFSLCDEQSSNSNESNLHSSDVKEKPVRPKREVDPNQPKKIKRCPHVWQFCADLLDNENFNPSIIKWLNKEKGIFKIVKPDKVADLWGAQKNRKSDKKMNYEKMARGMRYSRREGFFKKLDKEKNKPNEYGKQLVFQFSDKVVRDFEWKWSFST